MDPALIRVLRGEGHMGSIGSYSSGSYEVFERNDEYSTPNWRKNVIKYMNHELGPYKVNIQTKNMVI